MEKLSIKAIKLLQIEERLLQDIQDLKTMINAPERAKRATKQDKIYAKFENFKKPQVK